MKTIFNSEMKQLFSKRYIRISLFIFLGIICFIILLNYIIMPWYVSAKEITVPKVVGLSEKEAQKVLEDNDLEPIRGGESYNENYPEGSVTHQKPDPGSVVKVGRRVFLFVSSGVPKISVPLLKGKALRDARLTLERMDLVLGETTYVKSDSPRDIVLDQQYSEKTMIKAGTPINVTLSAGQGSAVVVPDLLGKSLTEAEKIIIENKLILGRINYQPSFSLLPNTVIDQYPSKGSQVKDSTSVDLFVTKNVSTPEEEKGD